jgi:hypothetical protein
MHCENAMIEFDNGDTYQGAVYQGKKSGSEQGAYTYLNGDSYVGGFRNDQKHCENGVMEFKKV